AGRSPAWVIATPILAAAVLARVLGADDLQARISAPESLLNAPLFSRIAPCAGLSVARGCLARSPASAPAPVWVRGLSRAAGPTPPATRRRSRLAPPSDGTAPG